MGQSGTQLQCPLQFDPQPRAALLLRLTPQLRNALAEAQAGGQKASIRVSNSGSLSVGDVSLKTCPSLLTHRY